MPEIEKSKIQQVKQKIAGGDCLSDSRLTKLDFTGIALDSQSKDINFGGVEFEEVNFGKNAFKENNNVYFGNAKFLSGNNRFSALNGENVLPGEANFGEIEVFENASIDFRRVIFPSKTNFGNAKFKGIVYFFNTKFSKTIGKTSFGKAEFSNEADFREAEFYGEEADFVEAKFSNDQKVANFSKAKFFTVANFRNAKFHNKTSFKETTFAERVLFIGNENNKIFENETDFSYVTFEKPELVKFQEVNLSKVKFLETNLEKIDFTAITWGKKESWFWKLANTALTKMGITVNWGGKWSWFWTRKIIYDEELATQERNWELVEKLYRQLKVNYENKRDYARAGDFHYGEMEMRRQAIWRDKESCWGKCLGWIFRNCSLTALYKYFSGYGEKWGVSAAWILFFASINMLLGLQQTKDGVLLFKYKFTGNPFDVFSKEVLLDYIQAFNYTLHTMAWQSHPPIVSIPPDNIIWITLQKIVGPTLLTLLVLAINRKFRR